MLRCPANSVQRNVARSIYLAFHHAILSVSTLLCGVLLCVAFVFALGLACALDRKILNNADLDAREDAAAAAASAAAVTAASEDASADASADDDADTADAPGGLLTDPDPDPHHAPALPDLADEDADAEPPPTFFDADGNSAIDWSSFGLSEIDTLLRGEREAADAHAASKSPSSSASRCPSTPPRSPPSASTSPSNDSASNPARYSSSPSSASSSASPSSPSTASTTRRRRPSSTPTGSSSRYSSPENSSAAPPVPPHSPHSNHSPHSTHSPHSHILLQLPAATAATNPDSPPPQPPLAPNAALAPARKRKRKMFHQLYARRFCLTDECWPMHLLKASMYESAFEFFCDAPTTDPATAKECKTPTQRLLEHCFQHFNTNPEQWAVFLEQYDANVTGNITAFTKDGKGSRLMTSCRKAELPHSRTGGNGTANTSPGMKLAALFKVLEQHGYPAIKTSWPANKRIPKGTILNVNRLIVSMEIGHCIAANAWCASHLCGCHLCGLRSHMRAETKWDDRMRNYCIEMFKNVFRGKSALGTFTCSHVPQCLFWPPKRRQ